jgi:hypothetical protein
MLCISILERLAVSIAALLVLASCAGTEPVKIGQFSFEEDSQEISPSKMQPICRALEDAGYVMPYGPPLGWYTFTMSQARWVFSGPKGALFTLPRGMSSLFILVDWNIPADLSMLPDAVSQETVDQLGEEAKKICRIVQREAARQGIGPVPVTIRLWDLFVGLELEYGEYAPRQEEGPALMSTTHCERITGLYIAKSSGLNPEGRTPGRCPSLFVPN